MVGALFPVYRIPAMLIEPGANTLLDIFDDFFIFHFNAVQP